MASPDFGLWSQGFHWYVDILKVLKAVSQVLDCLVRGHHSPTLNAAWNAAAVQDSQAWMGLVTLRAIGVGFWWMNTELKVHEVASRWPLEVCYRI